MNKTHGTTAPRETHDSQGYSVSDRRRKTFRYNGAHASLLARLPEKGDTWTAGWSVVSAELRRLPGGMGEMTVQCVRKQSSGSPQGGGGGARRTVEIEMAQVETDIRSLLDHSSYVNNLAAWEAADPVLKQDFKYINPNGGEETLTGQALTVARHILSGIESFLRFHPVVTATTVYEDRPGKGKIDYTALGRVSSGPSEAPSGFRYLKAGDHLTENTDGTWTRVERWIGAEKWSSFLYDGGNWNL